MYSFTCYIRLCIVTDGVMLEKSLIHLVFK